MRLISTLGWSPDVVLYPMKVLKPDEAYIIYGYVGSEEKQKTEKALEKIRDEWPYGNLHFLQVNPLSLKDTIVKVRERSIISDDSIVNITGGTKIMSFALALLAITRDEGEVPIIYVFTEKGDSGDVMRIKRIPLTLAERRLNFKKNHTAALILKALAESEDGELKGPEIRNMIRKYVGNISEGTFSDTKKKLLCHNLISQKREGRALVYSLNPGAWFFIEDSLLGGDEE